MKTTKIKWALTLSAAAAAVALVACGGGGGSPTLVATSDVTAPMSTTTGVALVGANVEFASGVSDFGTTGPTTLAIGGTSAQQTAGISSGGQTATADMNYGSCFFVIKTSNFNSSSPLAAGKTVVVNPCDMKVTTSGLVANGGETLTKIQMTMGTNVGVDGSVRVTITPDGVVKVGNSPFANITLTPATGGGS